MAPLPVSEEQKQELEVLVRNGGSPQVALRSRIPLLAEQGEANHAISQQLKASQSTILALRSAFASRRMVVAGVHRFNRRATLLAPELEQSILDTTLKKHPGEGTHLSVRGLARQLGVSRTIVHRVWQLGLARTSNA